MSQWSNLTDEEVLERAESLAQRYTQNHIDYMYRGAFIKEIVDRGLNKQFDITRIQRSKNPEYQVVGDYYTDRPRIFFTENPASLPKMYHSIGSFKMYPVLRAFPEPTYERIMYLYLYDPDLYYVPDGETPRELLFSQASAKMGYFYILRNVLRERPKELHIDVSVATFRADFAMDLVNAVNQEITDKMGVDRVVIHGLPRSLATELITKHNAAYGSYRWIACAAHLDN